MPSASSRRDCNSRSTFERLPSIFWASRPTSTCSARRALGDQDPPLCAAFTRQRLEGAGVLNKPHVSRKEATARRRLTLHVPFHANPPRPSQNQGLIGSGRVSVTGSSQSVPWRLRREQGPEVMITHRALRLGLRTEPSLTVRNPWVVPGPNTLEVLFPGCLTVRSRTDAAATPAFQQCDGAEFWGSLPR
jgi:hypothetical protein